MKITKFDKTKNAPIEEVVTDVVFNHINDMTQKLNEVKDIRATPVFVNPSNDNEFIWFVTESDTNKYKITVTKE